MGSAKRDDNYITTLIAVSNADGTTPVTLYADPTTHRLLVSATMGTLDDLSDVVITSGAQGDILYNNGTNWVNLAPGTSGKYLKTQGAAANPIWDTPTATITGTDTYVMFFDGANTPAGDAGFTYNKTTDTATLATALVCPTIVGGTGTTSDLNLKTTSGVGASGADMHFLVGNNGATEAMTILNDGNVGIGTTGPKGTLQLTSGTTGITFANNIAAQFGHNQYYSGGWKRAEADYATAIGLNEGAVGDIAFFNAGSGVADSAITWNTAMIIKNGGNVGIGVTSPTAYLHLKAGTATANTAPLKLNAGTVNTTPEAGAIEFDGTDFYLVI